MRRSRFRGKCMVKNCKNSLSNLVEEDVNGQKVTYHRFPVNGQRRLQWANALQISEEKVKDNCRICSNHFLEKDIDRTLSNVRIRENATPFSFCELPTNKPSERNDHDYGTKQKPKHISYGIIKQYLEKNIPTMKESMSKRPASPTLQEDERKRLKTVEKEVVETGENLKIPETDNLIMEVEVGAECGSKQKEHVSIKSEKEAQEKKISDNTMRTQVRSDHTYNTKYIKVPPLPVIQPKVNQRLNVLPLRPNNEVAKMMSTNPGILFKISPEMIAPPAPPIKYIIQSIKPTPPPKPPQPPPPRPAPTVERVDRSTCVSPVRLFNSPEVLRVRQAMQYMKSEYKKKISQLQQRNRRLEKQVTDLKNVLQELHDKHLVNDIEY